MKSNELFHLYSRLGFGIGNNTIRNYSILSRKEVVTDLFNNNINYEPLEIDLYEITQYFSNGMPDRKKVKELIKRSRSKVKELNYAWIERLVTSDHFIREKMCLFWANHFACNDKNIVHFQQYNNVLREHALGNFRALLISVSKSASMCKYLNNKQNKKSSPNENFARELMELFTLGRDVVYTENDIKEAARAFTGWNYNVKGDFVLRRRLHDDGEKTFLGKTGLLSGEDVIDMILSKKECARFICSKLYQYFVSDNLNKSHIDELSEVFYQNYDISGLLKYMVLSDWFYSEDIIGSKIKSPIELLVGMRKLVSVNFEKPKELLFIQKMLGQVLLFPPNVAGWKGGKSWIDANTVMLRLKLPSLLLNNGMISLDAKGAFEDSFSKFNTKKGLAKRLHVTADWGDFDNQDYSKKEINDRLLRSSLNNGVRNYIEEYSHASNKNYAIHLMSLPEYQLC